MTRSQRLVRTSRRVAFAIPVLSRQIESRQAKRVQPLKPAREKFTQYDDTPFGERSDSDSEASAGELASGNTRRGRRLLNTFGMSTACVAFRLRAFGAYGGSCVKK